MVIRTPRVATLSRRALLSSLAAAGAASIFRPRTASAQGAAILTRPIPSSGERLPLIGLGSWITFNVGDDPAGRDSRAEVMRAFFHDAMRSSFSNTCACAYDDYDLTIQFLFGRHTAELRFF